MLKYFLFSFVIFAHFNLSQSSEKLILKEDQEQNISFLPKEIRSFVIPKDFQTQLDLRLVNKNFNQEIQSLFTWKKVALNLTSQRALENYLNLQNNYKLPNVSFKVGFSLTQDQMSRFCDIFPRSKHLYIYPTIGAEKISINLPFMTLLSKHSIAFMQKRSQEDWGRKFYTKEDIFKVKLRKEIRDELPEKISEELECILVNFHFLLYGINIGYVYYSYVPSIYYLKILHDIKFYDDLEYFPDEYITLKNSLRKWEEIEERGELSIAIHLDIKPQWKEFLKFYKKALEDLRTESDKQILRKIKRVMWKNRPSKK